MRNVADEAESPRAVPRGARATLSCWRHRTIALAVLLIGVALSFVISQSARDETARTAQSRFDAAASHAAFQVERRFAAYVEVLAGLRALFHANDVSREAFHRYAEALDLKRAFPGFQVLNYALHVPAASKLAFETATRRDVAVPQHERFAISPPGARDAYYPFTLIEPLLGNEHLLGKDIAVTPVVRAALELSRDTGRLTASGKLIQNRAPGGEAGLAMRLPVYRHGMPLDTVEQRRAAYVGSVGAGFLVTRMLGDLPGVAQGLRLRLFDGGPEVAADTRVGPPATPPDKLLFDTLAAGAGADNAAAAPPHPEGRHRHIQGFDLGGRRWIVETTAPLGDGAGSFEHMLPAIILFGGSSISALLAGVMLSLMGSQRRAVSLAHDMTQSLRRSEQRLAEAQGLAKLGSWVLDGRSAEIECTDEARRIYGLTSAATPLTLPRLLAIVPAAQRAALGEAVQRAQRSDARVEIEHAVQMGDHGKRWVHVDLRRSTEDGATIVNATVRDDTARHRSALRLELAHNIARELAAEDEPENAVAYILSSIGAHSGWHAAACWLRDDNAQVRCLHAWACDDESEMQGFVTAMRRWSGPRSGSALDTLWGGASPLWRAIPAVDAGHSPDAIAARFGLQASLAVPVNAGGQLAVLEFFSRAPIGVDRDIEGFMRSVASQLAQYLRRKQAEKALRHVANHDALTGLASRPLLHERLAHAIQRATRTRSRVAVLFMDLDRFKHVNDSLGHSAGDALLRACAVRLRECVRVSDLVARFGGDEFVVVLEDVGDTSDVIAPLTKVLNRISAPVEVNACELLTTASIGVSLFPDDGEDAETLLMNADAAMYRAKEKGPGTYHFYSAQMNAQGQQRLSLESGLHRALEREELFLVYQPKLDLATGHVTGVEALMRWNHPSLGMISPAQFIPIAEDTGLIESMGHWALEVACRAARRWQDEGHPVQVSVNLSARQLNRPHLAQEVAKILDLARLAPGQLELEITESAVMRNPVRAAAQLQELRQLGVSLAIDDFGTGYSSLSYLQRFPLCTLKIDRSFVKDLPADEDAAGLTAGIIALAHRLRMTVVAEGVETIEQLGFLRANGCNQIQGFYLSKPIAADEMSRFLERDVRNLVSPTVAA